MNKYNNDNYDDDDNNNNNNNNNNNTNITNLPKADNGTETNWLTRKLKKRFK